MKTSEVIKAAYKLIRKPENWTQRAFARDANGNVVFNSSPEAACFCAAGAVRRVMPDDIDNRAAWALLLADAVACGHGSVHAANDCSAHDAVLRAFRRVYRKAKRLESEGKL